MAFSGIKYTTSLRNSTRSLNGFYGIRVELPLTGVRVEDYRGRGLSNVTITAVNSMTGNTFTNTTDSNGSAFMQLDQGTDVVIEKDMIKKTVKYTGGQQVIFTIDLPFIQSI